MLFGWAGTILRINLSEGKIAKQTLGKDLMVDYVGGRGVNSKILYEETKRVIDPFDPEARLIFGVGPLVGAFPGAGRFTVTAKSPHTGIHGDSNAGGFWGTELKLAGYDNIVIVGKAKEPVYLWVYDDHVEIRDATHLWGLTTWDAQEEIREELGDQEIKTVTIGPAGEKMVRYATITGDWGRDCGRCGIGAVMGSKNLKVIAVRGTGEIRVADRDRYIEVMEEFLNSQYRDPTYKVWSYYGTPYLLDLMNKIGSQGFLNNQFAYIEDPSTVSAETFMKYVIKKQACFGCVVHCGHYHAVEEGPYKCFGDGFEYEGLGAFGPRVGNLDYPSVLKASTLCSQLGLDVISTGHAIAIIMECFQRGLIDETFTGGIPFKWGDRELIINTIHDIAYRRGFGDILAEGALKVAKKIGKGAEKYVVQVKGLEFTGGDQRLKKATVLAYSVATRGGDHLRGLPMSEYYGYAPEFGKKKWGSENVVVPESYDPVKAKVVRQFQTIATLCDCMGMCKFNTEWLRPESITAENLVKIFNVVIGMNRSFEELVEVADRVFSIEHSFNIREAGLSRKDDIPPWKYLNERNPTGPSKGEYVDAKGYEHMLDEYYRVRGWDIKTGRPTRPTLEKLKLKHVADELESLGLLPT